MDIYAVIKTGGKQIQVKVGQEIYVEKLDFEVGTDVIFTDVIFIGGDKTIIGSPFIAGVTVIGTVKKHGKKQKVVTFKYKPKKGSHRKQGHRQLYTKVFVNSINV